MEQPEAYRTKATSKTTQFIESLQKFVDFLKKAEREPSFPKEEYDSAMKLASKFEKYTNADLSPEQTEKLSKRLQFVKFRGSSLSIKELSCARHYLLRVCMNNPYLGFPTLEWIVTDFFKLADDEDEDAEVETKRVLTKDISTRVHLTSSRIVLSMINFHLFESFGFESASEEDIDYGYPFTALSISKKACARIIKLKLINSMMNQKATKDTSTYLDSLYPHLINDTNCLETIVFVLLVNSNEDASIPFEPEKEHCNVVLSEWLLLNADSFRLWKVHPWLLTEVSQHHLKIFKSYLAYLSVRLKTLLSSKSTSFEDLQLVNEEISDIRLRFKYCLNRSSNLQLCCEHVLNLWKENPLTRWFTRENSSDTSTAQSFLQ